MSDPYQLGSDAEWLKHSNHELTRLVKKRNAQLNRVRLFCLVLALALGWVIYRFSRTQPVEELWRFDIPKPAPTAGDRRLERSPAPIPGAPHPPDGRREISRSA